MDQGRQGRDQVDAAVMLLVRRQRRASSASCAGLQSRQLHADTGPAGGNQALVADQPAGKTRQNWRQGRAPWPLRHLPDGRGRGAEGIVPRDSAADRGTTTTATTSACVRPPMVMRSRATDGGVRPNASENGQIGPSTTVRAARGDGSCPNCASALQGARETASIHGSSGVIWRIPVTVGLARIVAHSLQSNNYRRRVAIGGIKCAYVSFIFAD